MQNIVDKTVKMRYKYKVFSVLLCNYTQFYDF